LPDLAQVNLYPGIAIFGGHIGSHLRGLSFGSTGC
jgi:hypothetical protein